MDVIVYLDINDELLADHCKKRHAAFEDAKNVKAAIENTIKRKSEENNVKIYRIEMKS